MEHCCSNEKPSAIPQETCLQQDVKMQPHNSLSCEKNQHYDDSAKKDNHKNSLEGIGVHFGLINLSTQLKKLIPKVSQWSKLSFGQQEQILEDLNDLFEWILFAPTPDSQNDFQQTKKVCELHEPSELQKRKIQESADLMHLAKVLCLINIKLQTIIEPLLKGQIYGKECYKYDQSTFQEKLKLINGLWDWIIKK
jgi:hypothetical protein